MAERAWRPRVFVSSVSGGLAPYRHAVVEVCQRLGLEPVHMEEFLPERPAPLEVCRREVESCDVFVLLLAHRYGARPPGEDRSYTELEYEWALGCPGISLLAYVVDQTFAWPPLDIDRGADAEALGRFVERVTSRHVVNQFAELSAFRQNLILTLRSYEVTDGPAVGREPLRSTRRRLPQPPVFHAVPPYVGSAPFTGRLDDLATLDAWGQSADPVMVVEAIGGTGKSALTWEWAQNRAPAAIDGLTGRMWWSFYDGSASMTRFMREVLIYTAAHPPEQVRRMTRSELAANMLATLRSGPYLLVLDGFERLLAAYHRFDPSKLRDDEVEPAKRSLIESHADAVVRTLVGAGPSKVLISSRLMPDALEGRFGQRMPGVRHLRLPGLTDADTVTLLGRLGVRGHDRAVRGFFQRLGNHPLLVGVVAGLVRDYRPDPGGFVRWLSDPSAGGALGLLDLDLSQRRAHILDAALAGLPPAERRLLEVISVFAGAVDWATLDAINPFLPEPPTPVEPDYSVLGPRPFLYGSRYEGLLWREDAGNRSGSRRRQAWEQEWQAWNAVADRLRAEAERNTEDLKARWLSGVAQAKVQLDRTLKDLADCGLLWWDRPSNSYDLHPIVRAYVHDKLDENDRIQANERVHNHFEALPSEDLHRVTSVEDVRRTIMIFRALVGAGRLHDACRIWDRRLEDALGSKLGAHATVVELLSPLALHGGRNVRADLAAAYSYLRRHEEAIDQETSLLASSLDEENLADTKVSLLRLGLDLAGSGAELGYSRCLELRQEIIAAVGDEPDAAQYLACGAQAATHGQVEQALALLDQAEALRAPANYPWFDGDIQLWRLFLELVADGSLTEERLVAAGADLHLWLHRRRLAQLRYDLLARQGQFERALATAQDLERLERNAGMETVPAESALQLSMLGRWEEGSAATEEALAQLPRLHPAARPHYALARALWQLERRTDAVSHAREAYRQAWRDGPPHCHYWELRDARELLERMGVTPPDLPRADPATVKVPLEDELRAFIAKLKAEERGEKGHAGGTRSVRRH